MNKEDIIDYVAQTPYNSNKKVLGDMLDTLIEENSNRALIVPFTHEGGNTYSFPSEMSGEILTALYEGRKVISSGLGDGPYEATMWGDEEISFQKLSYGDNLFFERINFKYSGKSTLQRDIITSTPDNY